MLHRLRDRDLPTNENSVSMNLRRPNLIRWNNYMDECIEVLETSDAALPSDRRLCQHVRLQQINEDIGQQFSMDDPSAAVSLLDHRVQYAIKAFENRLQDWNKAVLQKDWNGMFQRDTDGEQAMSLMTPMT